MGFVGSLLFGYLDTFRVGYLLVGLGRCFKYSKGCFLDLVFWLGFFEYYRDKRRKRLLSI